jgi:hypothetical protein
MGVLSLAFGILSAGMVGAAALLPLEQLGHSYTLTLPADRSFHANHAI